MTPGGGMSAAATCATVLPMASPRSRQAARLRERRRRAQRRARRLVVLSALGVLGLVTLLLTAFGSGSSRTAVPLVIEPTMSAAMILCSSVCAPNTASVTSCGQSSVRLVRNARRLALAAFIPMVLSALTASRAAVTRSAAMARQSSDVFRLSQLIAIRYVPFFV